jgi:hypothetical protein
MDLSRRNLSIILTSYPDADCIILAAQTREICAFLLPVDQRALCGDLPGSLFIGCQIIRRIYWLARLNETNTVAERKKTIMFGWA